MSVLDRLRAVITASKSRGLFVIAEKVEDLLADFDTDSQLIEGLDAAEEDGHFPVSEDDDTDSQLIEGLDATEEDGHFPVSEDDDTEARLPLAAVPHKERKRGPRPEDVSMGRPDWWSAW